MHKLTGIGLILGGAATIWVMASPARSGAG
jgi:hypothetical protein